MEDYKKIYKEMMDFFDVNRMEDVCLKLGFSQGSYKNWTRAKRVSNKALKKFNDLKKLATNSINSGNVVQVGGVGNMIHNTSSVLPVEDYKKTYKEMLNFFGVNRMEDVCLKLGFSKETYQNWTKCRKVSDKAMRRFIELKGLALNSINSGNVVQVGGVGNMIHNTSSVPPTDVDMQELIYLIQTYATPKMKLEIREKLLAIKNLDEKMDSKIK